MIPHLNDKAKPVYAEERRSAANFHTAFPRFLGRTSLAILFALSALSGAHAQAEKEEAKTADQRAEKLDVNDLEKRYWAAKDTDFSVVQNRLFSKDGRIALSAYYAMFVDEPWSDGPTYGVNLNYYLSERYGVELAYSSSDTEDSDATARLSEQGGKPNHGKLKTFYGAAFNWVPFYAKMSVLNSQIIYFDMSLSVGGGVTEYEQQREEGSGIMKTSPTLTFDITQHFFLTNWLALRFDFKNRWYNEEVIHYKPSSAVNGNRVESERTNHTSLIGAGLTFYF